MTAASGRITGRRAQLIELPLKVVLVLATLVCLASIGGAMLVAWPVLVPAHWWAARRSGPCATAGWAFLAAASVYEATWMLVYWLTESQLGLLVGLLTAIGTMLTFVRRGVQRVPRAA